MVAVALFIPILGGGGCGRSRFGASTGSQIRLDGSSTAYPIVSALADDFSRSRPGVDLTVNKSGTGSGVQKFERGELDIAAASRPISPAEDDALRRAGVQFIEVPFAYDGVSVIVSLKNRFAQSMTLAELRRAWQVGSAVHYWSDIRPGWPREKIDFYGPTDNHGTFDYFSDAMTSRGGAMRTDIEMNQEYNAIVQAVADDPHGIGYVGLSYYADNRDKVRAVAIDCGQGPVLPSRDTVSNGTYRELSRPLFLYVSKKAMDARPVVREFVEFALSSQGANDVAEAHYVPLPVQTLDVVRLHVKQERTGTLFDREPPTISVAEVTRHETAGR